ncbi:MAG: cytochrome c oxidase assembly protein [Saccharospirillaceae bacterium]|nr:cytochrome c oxidase assembly protein [Pseudomonadales bacterium]NRB79112.1 cytochrome c oxidase assembly protein [Saccharospirillaceae bacterium]
MNNKKLTIKLIAFALAMLLFGFSLVPLYGLLCEVTGINGKIIGASEKNTNIRTSTQTSEQVVKLQILTHNQGPIPIQIKTDKIEIYANVGQEYLISFEATNTGSKDIVIQAVPSVSPGLTAKYLHKIECFCFAQQAIKKGETVNLSLNFYIDELIDPKYKQMSLSYAIFDISDDIKPEKWHQLFPENIKIAKVSK